MVSTPILWYNITIKLLELEVSGDGGNGTDNSDVDIEWKLVSTLNLSPATPLGRSKDGRVCHLN